MSIRMSTKKAVATKKTVATKKPKKLTWTHVHAKLYDALFNRFSTEYPADYESFITDNANPKTRNGLLKFIHSTSYKDGSKKNIFFMVGRYLEIEGDSRYKAYLQEGHDLREIVEKHERKNEQTDKEKEFYRPHEYFVELINQHKVDDEYRPRDAMASGQAYKSMDFKQHIQFLILCLVTLQPPLRSSFFYTAQHISQKAQNNKEDNYIFLNAKTKAITYIVNNDKVSTSKYYSMRPNLKNIDVTDPFLKELLFYSFKTYPRTYLIQKSSSDNEPVAQATLLSYLRTVTSLSGIDVDIMRSSYITYIYKSQPNVEVKSKLADEMRHSLYAATVYYDKGTLVPITLDEEAQQKIIIENQILKDQIESVKEEKDEKKAYTKKRYDILYRLNRSDITKPKQSTIDKYFLQKDPTGKWY